LDGKWKCCGEKSSFARKCQKETQHTANQHNHIEMTRKSHSKQQNPRRNLLVRVVVFGVALFEKKAFFEIKLNSRKRISFFSLKTTKIKKCKNKRSLHPTHDSRTPSILSSPILHLCKKRNLVEQKSVLPDKRNALRTNFQRNTLNTRGQKRKTKTQKTKNINSLSLQKGEEVYFFDNTVVFFLHHKTKKNKKTKHTQKQQKILNIFDVSLCVVFLRKRRLVTTTTTHKYTIEIWLILPVVICLFQGLSHACLRITALQESAHGSLHQTQSAAKMLRSPQNWIPWRNAKLIHEFIRMSSIHAACSAGRSEASCE
jgi:hypothetical protein